LYQGAVAAGTAKATASWYKIFKLGIVSGCHIGFGAYLAITVGGACPGLAAENPGLQKVMCIMKCLSFVVCERII
jgi:formate/nitrite transporter FocA (FNT family)